MVGGGSLVRKDVPPFIKVSREPVQYEGVNSLGLKRRRFSEEAILLIKDAYRFLFLSDMNITRALEHIENTLPDTPERNEIVRFVRDASRGIVKGPVSSSSASPNGHEE
jgi:UDP-N-acetylglucosamine acyltransferase